VGDLGKWALIFTLFIVPYAIMANLIGIRTRDSRWILSGKSAVLALVGLTTLSSGSLIYSLINGDFRYLYVAQYSSTDMSLFYKVTAFWGGNAGSLLLWLWILSIFTALVTWSNTRTVNSTYLGFQRFYCW
jgi:cytochrome c-type biogenesis protein CcmF